jgi:phosphohistidine phosphatase
VAEACTYTGEIKQTRELYLAESQDYVEELRQVADKHTRVLVVGHNPGLEMLIEALTDEATAMPTAALAQIELSVKHWRDLDLSTKCRLVNVWLPKELG